MTYEFCSTDEYQILLWPVAALLTHVPVDLTVVLAGVALPRALLLCDVFLLRLFALFSMCQSRPLTAEICSVILVLSSAWRIFRISFSCGVSFRAVPGVVCAGLSSDLGTLA